MREIHGDLFDSPYRIIGQGVNTRGVMGAGIAKPFRDKWPAMYADYRLACVDGRLATGGLHTFDVGDRVVFNLASQDDPGPRARLDWLATAAGLALEEAHRLGEHTVALPRIGCGIGGLDWKDVSWVLQQVERNRFGSFVVYSLD